MTWFTPFDAEDGEKTPSLSLTPLKPHPPAEPAGLAGFFYLHCAFSLAAKAGPVLRTPVVAE